ncbi:MAG: potassium channel family protein [Candidatus Curtissbacteria bacterium]|nr:potassium channel family protein [Candidatus Curtissbacteria bacterium]
MGFVSGFSKVVKVIRTHLYVYLAGFVVISVIISSSLILKFESGYSESQIKTVNDAIWWSAVGVSTIGIGNIVPVSDSGRYLTIFLMVVGVIVFSVITAKIASIFTEEEVREDLDHDLKIIEGDLHKVEKGIEGELAVEDKVVEDKLDKLEKEVENLENKKLN